MKHRMVSLRRISVTTLSPLDPDSAQKTRTTSRDIYIHWNLVKHLQWSFL